MASKSTHAVYEDLAVGEFIQRLFKGATTIEIAWRTDIDESTVYTFISTSQIGDESLEKFARAIGWQKSDLQRAINVITEAEKAFRAARENLEETINAALNNKL